MSTIIETIHTQDSSKLFTADTVTQNLEAIRTEALSIVPDITTDKGRKEIASQAHKVAQSKVAIDKVGAALVKPLKDQAKVIDVQRKRYKDMLDQLKEEVRKPLTDYELAEAKKQQDSDQVFFQLEQLAEVTDALSGDILQVGVLEGKISKLDKLDVAPCQLVGRFDEAVGRVTMVRQSLETALKNRKLLNQAAAAEQAKEVEQKPEQKPQPDRRPAGMDRTREVCRAIAEALAPIVGDESKARDVVTAIYNSRVPHLQINYE